MRIPRMNHKPVIGIGIAAIAAALCLAALASDLARIEKSAAVEAEQYADFIENEVFDIQDLAEGAEIQRRRFNRMTPPGFSWVQPMFPSVVPFDADNFDEKFLDELLGEDKNSVAIYPLSLTQDPKTRETLVYNAEGKLIATIPADRVSREWPEDADPARVTLILDLLPAEDVEPYLYTESRIANTLSAYNAMKMKRSNVMAKNRLGGNEFGFCCSQITTNGTMLIAVTNGTDIAEIYTYTVGHTSSVVVSTWTNEYDEVITRTNTVWHPVSPGFNGIESEWVHGTTNLVLTNGAGTWEDTNITGNDRIRYYAASKRQDRDGDGLSDGQEIFLYRTDPEMSDTDGDGMPDGWEVKYGMNARSGLDESLLGWWKLDDGEGTNALNSATENFHGELIGFTETTNSGWAEAGKIGGALRFDGSDDRVEIVQATAMLTGGPFTVSAWVWLDGNCTSDYPQIISDMSILPSYHYIGYCIGFNSSAHAFGMVDNTMLTDNTARIEQWIWVAMEYDGAQMQLYLNGAPAGSAVTASFTNAGNARFSLGDGQDPFYTEKWEGMLDDIRVYAGALGPSGIADMYDAFGDKDGDGLTNIQEYKEETNPTLADTDGDGLSDGDEVNTYGTSPEDADTDADSIPDGVEISLGLDPNNATDAEEDPDGDHLTNREEYELGLPMFESNEVTFVYYNPNPAELRRSSGGGYIYLDQDNLEAKAVSTYRQKEGYPEYTNSFLPPSDPPKWYLSREARYEANGDGHYSDEDVSEHMIHSASRLCLKQFDPNGWPDTPSNHVCRGEESYYDNYHLYGGYEEYHSIWQVAYEYEQPNEYLVVHGTQYLNGAIIPLSYNVNTCLMPLDDELEVSTHTSSGISNAYDHYLWTWGIPDPDSFEYETTALTNEYTTDMLLFYTVQDLPPLLNWAGITWGQRWTRENHRQEPWIESLPTNEIFSASLLSEDHTNLFLQDLQYRWMIPTTSGVVYKMMWLEAFRPQGMSTYSDYRLQSYSTIGTGGDVYTPTYTAGRPWTNEFFAYGTIEPIGFLVELECSLAEKSPVGFGSDPPELVCYPVWAEEKEAARIDQNKQGRALTILFDKASTPEGDPTNFNVTLHVHPEDLPGVTWAKTDGPNSGTLLNSDQPVATFSNATKGGLYTFTTTIPGADPITSQMWLPVSGPDISVDFQREIDYLDDWIVDYDAYKTTRALSELPAEHHSNTNRIEEKKAELWLNDLETIGLDFDYVTPHERWQDICGLAHAYTTDDSAGDSSRFVIAGNSRPYVTDFAKRNNMGFAMFAYHMGIPSWLLPYGPNAYRFFKGGIVGAKDDQYARESYDAGIALAQGYSLASVIQTNALDMQPPGMRVSKEWPGGGIAETNSIGLIESTRALMEQAAGR